MANIPGKTMAERARLLFSLFANWLTTRQIFVAFIAMALVINIFIPRALHHISVFGTF
jgi:hypothetical protein